MYSFEQIPTGSPWPSGMEISVEDSNLEFIKLAYIHYKFQLKIRPEFSKLIRFSTVIDLRNVEETNYVKVATSWNAAWNKLFHKISNGLDSFAFTTNEAMQNLEQLTEYSHEQFQSWINEVQLHITPPNPTSLALQPEMVCLEALVKAWKQGLNTIVVSPIRGEFFDRVTPEVLIVSHSTRSDPRAYNEALNSGL
jgi:hypothetical protein